VATNVRDVSNPPRNYFSVWQRLFRGYGPLAVLALLVLLVALLVPSKAQTTSNTTVGGPLPSDSGATPGVTIPGKKGTTGSTVVSGGKGATGIPAGNGSAASQPGVQPCADRKLQVPGDPYSPPCFTFSGSNNGKTYHGVNDKEIHVAFRVLNEKGFQQTLAELAGASLVDKPADVKRTVSALADYFNTHYQFYGRKIVIDFYDGQGSNTSELLGKGRPQAQADADTVKDMKSFADLSATSEPYGDALAQRDIVGFGDPYLSVKWHDQHRPYIWSIATAGTQVANFAAEYSVKKLCGGKANYAGGALKGIPRKFATFAPQNPWYQESVEVARETFKAGKCDPGLNVAYELDLGTMSNQANNLIAQMKDAKVTTILCGCDPIIPVFLSGSANRQGYYPEFIIVGTALTDTDIVGQLWNQEFAKHSFGVSSLIEPVDVKSTIGYAAYRAVRKDEPAFSVDLIYYQMAQMAIGLQMAGPKLTPLTFEQGMFDYPEMLGPAGLWGFGPHDMTTADDVREIYWDPNATSNYNHKLGAFVETDHKRYRYGQIPSGPPKVPVPS
jgi:hypothetical protein